MKLEDIENILQTYTLEEILEINDLSQEDLLYFLVEHDYVELPNPRPLDVEDDQD